jgi:hypothetical protein
MNTMLNISSADEVLTPGEVPWTIPGTTKSERSLTGALRLLWTRPWLSYAAALVHVATAIFAVLYSFGGLAFGVALLCYAFSR